MVTVTQGAEQSYKEYGEAGLLFIAIEDPYSRITRSISKCEYSAIGFYAPSMSTGILKIIVTLVDLFGADKPTWLSSGCTLDRLIKNPLVTRLAIKPLQYANRQDLARFRACICQGSEMIGHPTFEDTIYSLFGYRDSGENRIATGVDFVNQVITLYGAIDKIQPGSSISLTAIDELHPSKCQDQLSVLGMMGLPFAQEEECIDISSYIVDSSLFGPLVDITLPVHHPLVIEEEKRKILNLYRPHLIRLFSTFVELLLGNPDFFSTILERLKSGRKFAQSSEKILYELLMSLSERTEDSLEYLTGRVDALDLKKKLEEEYFTTCLYLGKEAKTFPEEEGKSAYVSAEDMALRHWANSLLLQVENFDITGRPIRVDIEELRKILGKETLDTYQGKIPAFLVTKEETIKTQDYYFPHSGNPTSYLGGMDKEELLRLYKSLGEGEDCEALRESISEQLIVLHEISL